MKLETIYAEIKENIENPLGLVKLLEKIEDEIRTQTSFKTTPKTRVNAIKKVASKDKVRPILQGYAIQDEFKVVTDSYHAIAIHQDEMPLPLVATSDELEKLGFKSEEEYKEKYGNTSLIPGVYPNLRQFWDFDKSNEIQVNLDDIEVFYKTNKDKKAGFEINGCTYKISYLKNLIDILGKDLKWYFTGEINPLYVVNSDGEIGLVLPFKTY